MDAVATLTLAIVSHSYGVMRLKPLAPCEGDPTHAGPLRRGLPQAGIPIRPRGSLGRRGGPPSCFGQRGSANPEIRIADHEEETMRSEFFCDLNETIRRIRAIPRAELSPEARTLREADEACLAASEAMLRSVPRQTAKDRLTEAEWQAYLAEVARCAALSRAVIACWWKIVTGRVPHRCRRTDALSAARLQGVNEPLTKVPTVAELRQRCTPDLPRRGGRGSERSDHDRH
jgi:hypothetical protein